MAFLNRLVKRSRRRAPDSAARQLQEAVRQLRIGLEGAGEEVLAETCEECGSYRKIVNQEKNPMVEPLADDLASLMLDLLMSETKFQRASANPLLFVAVAEEQDGELSNELVDPAA